MSTIVSTQSFLYNIIVILYFWHIIATIARVVLLLRWFDYHLVFGWACWKIMDLFINITITFQCFHSFICSYLKMATFPFKARERVREKKRQHLMRSMSCVCVSAPFNEIIKYTQRHIDRAQILIWTVLNGNPWLFTDFIWVCVCVCIDEKATLNG